MIDDQGGNVQEFNSSPLEDIKLAVYPGSLAEDQDSDECEVILYYWSTLPFPIPPFCGLIVNLLTCFGYTNCVMDKINSLKSSNKSFSQTGHVSMEVRYDKGQSTDYQRSYYISLYPDENECCSTLAPKTAVLQGRRMDLDLEAGSITPAKKLVLKGLNFRRIKEQINRIFNFNVPHKLDTYRRWSIENGIWHSRQQLQSSSNSKDPLRVLNINPAGGGVKWGFVRNCCFQQKTYSCSNIVNDILVEGGLAVNKCTRLLRILESLALCFIAAIIAALPALIDYLSDGKFDRPTLDIGFSVGVGVFAIGLLYEHGLAFDELFCWNKSPCIRPQSVIWKAEHKTGEKASISSFKQCLCFKGKDHFVYDSKKSNFPLPNGVDADPCSAPPTGSSPYSEHVCSSY